MSRRRMRTVAGLAGGAVGVALLAGVGPAPTLLAGASGDDADGSSATSTTLPTASPSSPLGDRVVDAAGAGTVSFTRGDAGLALVSAVPTTGWRVEVEDAGGEEIEVDFRRASRRVQVDIEIEDGAVRERVRSRDEADGSEVRLEDGAVVRIEGDDRVADDRLDDDVDDGDDRDDHDDHGDDNSDRGPGSGGHGADDPPGDDHGGDSDSED